MLYWANSNNALCIQRHYRYKLATDENPYYFDNSGLNGFLNKGVLLRKTIYYICGSGHTPLVFNFMQLQNSLERYLCYFQSWIFCFAASEFIFHLLWKRQYNSILKPCSIKLHLHVRTSTNSNRHQNVTNGSPPNDIRKLKLILLPWIILVTISNSSAKFSSFEGLSDSFFLRCECMLTGISNLVSQGSEIYATVLPRPGSIEQFTLQRDTQFSKTVNSYTFLWKIDC